MSRHIFQSMFGAACIALAFCAATSCTKYTPKDRTPQPIFNVDKATAVDKQQGIYTLNDITFYYDPTNNLVVRVPQDFTYNVAGGQGEFFSPDSLIVLKVDATSMPLPDGNVLDNLRDMMMSQPSDTPIRLRELNDSVISGEGIAAGRPFFIKWAYQTDSLNLNLQRLRMDYEPFDFVEQIAEKIFPTTVTPFPHKAVTDIADEEQDWI